MINNKTFNQCCYKADLSQIRSVPSIYLIFILATIFFFDCSSSKTNNENGIQTVDIRSAIDKKESTFLSEIINGDIEYIPLESKKEILLGEGVRIYATDSLIIAFAKQQIYLFDRKTEKFLREIGNYGKGPDGYRQTVTSYPYDENKNLFYTSGWKPEIYHRYNSGTIGYGIF